MKVKQFISPFFPKFFKNRLRSIRNLMHVRAFNSLPRQECSPSSLQCINGFSISDILDQREINSFWESSKNGLSQFSIPDGTGGVNPGDRRAIYHLVCKLKPASILEIGTHIGASTLHIASALFMSQIRNGENAILTTLDIRDVNSSDEKPWLNYGVEFSPKEMITKLQFDSFVNFVADGSLDFLSNTKQRFDFIFLDGDHSATTVYQEIPAALRILNNNGIILLHDYYPKMNPIWSNGLIKDGPFRATERLINEGANLTVLPLGKLPWPTKFNSNLTSLALLLRKN